MSADCLPTGSKILTIRVTSEESDETFDDLVLRAMDALYSSDDVADFEPAVAASSSSKTIEIIYTPSDDDLSDIRDASDRIWSALTGILERAPRQDVAAATSVLHRLP